MRQGHQCRRPSTGRRALHEEALSNIVIEREPAIDPADQHQASELVGAGDAIGRLQSGANLLDARRRDGGTRGLEPSAIGGECRH